MSKKLLIKLWNVNRTKKVFVSIELSSESDMLKSLIDKGSEKMNINGCRLVLEDDGTSIDNCETLEHVCKETIILLEPNEEWMARDILSDTVTFCSDRSSVSVSNHSYASDFSPSSSKNADTFTTDRSKSKYQLSDIQEDSSNRPHTSSNSYENPWLSFEIPWSKVSECALKDCKAGNRNSRSVSNVIQTVVDAMREICKNPSNKAVRIVANKIVQTYPLMFQDIDDDGTVMGHDGAIIVFSQLNERLKYLNRPSKRTNDNESSAVIPLNKKKKMLSAKAGCVNWQPPITDATTDRTDNDDDLKEKLKSVDFSVLDDVTKQMLEDTYPSQRFFLNLPDSPTVNQINVEWPILLSEHGIQWHFFKLMGREITELGDNMLKKYTKIVDFGIKKKYVAALHETEEEKLLDIIKTVTGFFSEPPNNIFCHINEELVLGNIVPPQVVSFNEGNTKLYAVAMEGRKLMPGISLKSALELTFALYFNFNLEYPKSVSNTFEIFQKYFLKIYPEQGTKNRKSSKSKMKIASFINKLRQ